MKELTIEEKAQRYDEVIETFDVILNLNTVKKSGTIFADDVRKILPELKESEDDVMRKMAIKAVHAPEAQSCIKSWGANPEDVIAWLEKQGEKGTNGNEREIPNSAWSEDDEEKLNQLHKLI